MFEKDARQAVLLPADGGLWIVRGDREGSVVVRDTSGDREPLRIDSVGDQWAATVDHAGIPWLVTAEAGTIHARRYHGGGWGPRLQVSTQPYRAEDPFVVADEYANVWIFWRYEEPSEIWMCRMGPRSGQETRVAPAPSGRLLAVATREGRLHAVYERDGKACLASGEEHAGFAAPVPLDVE